MSNRLSLSQFIRKNLGSITEEWKNFAAKLAPSRTSEYVLRDHVHQILFFIADDIETPESVREGISKSQGERDDKPSPARIHASLRYDIGFNMVDMVLEYRALRTTILRLWIKTVPVLTDSDALSLIRFNEAVDQLLTQSVEHFMEKYKLHESA